MIYTKPFVHLFRTRNCCYIYDVNTNVFLKIPEDTYDSFQKHYDDIEGCKDLTTQNNVLKILKGKGYLSVNRPDEIMHPMDNMITYFLDNSIRMITLQITQQCNLRCSYCAYSGNYSHRGHSSKIMTLETAKKGIDFAIKHSKDSKNVNISFYGGEPLLRFDFIKECVLYAEKKSEGKDISFNMTTNGTLLSDKIIEFMILHSIHITISLDGPKEIHDKNRTLPNGTGSFEIIMKNIKNIKNKFPEYLDKYVSFNVVMDSVNDFSCYNDFFMSYDTIKDLFVNASGINPLYSNTEIQVSEEFIEKINYERFKVLLEKLGKIDSKYTSKLLGAEFEKIKETLNDHRMPQKQIQKRVHHSGPCMPGVNRLFLSTEGVFYPCEKVSEESEVMKIGDIENGFYIDKVKNLLNIGKLTENKCKNCWAFRFCYACAAFADEIDNLSGEKKLKYCNDIKHSIEDMFITYCTMKEFGYDFDNGYLKELSKTVI